MTLLLLFPSRQVWSVFFIFDSNKGENRKIYSLPPTFYLFLFYFFIGVALIAKGLIGIVFPFAIVAFYYLLSWKFPSKTVIISLFWGTILGLIVACIWYVPVYQQNGWAFIDEFFIQHHFQRFTSNKYQHPQPFWFFWLVLPLLTLPWLPFFLASIWKFGRNLKSSIRNPQLTFAIAWLLVPLVFFSISGSKLPGYILPSLPAALILTADWIWQFVRKSKNREFAMQILAFVMFVFVAILMQFFVMNYAPHETVKKLIDTANAQGYTSEKVLNMHTLSHNAEFYAPNRLVRTDDGKQRKFYGVLEIVTELQRENVSNGLVLIPLENVTDLVNSNLLDSKVLDNNGELAIVAVNLK